MRRGRVCSHRGSQPVSRTVTSARADARHSTEDVEVVLGVDPGLIRTGYAVLRRTPQGPVLCEAGIIRTHRDRSLADRVHEIVVGLRQLFDDYRPDVLAVEQVFSLVRNPKSALLMAHARGGILLTAVDYGVPVVHYTPTQVKRLLTGSGRASKEQIQRAVQNELNLRQLPEPHDVADAFAVALCHYHSRRRAV